MDVGQELWQEGEDSLILAFALCYDWHIHWDNQAAQHEQRKGSTSSSG